MGGLGFQEILLIAVVILILFGAKKIPDLMKGLGRGVREFNDAKQSMKDEMEGVKKEPAAPVATEQKTV